MQPDQEAAVLVEDRECVRILRLNRIDSHNALGAEIKEAMSEAVERFFADDTARCLLITGMASCFCAGGNVNTFAGRERTEENRQAHFDSDVTRMKTSHHWLKLLLTGEKPVVVAVNGPAAGAGFGLALTGDIIFMADEAFLQPAFPKVGLAADFAIALTLPALVGMGRAKNILLNNTRISATEAVAMGIASASAPRSKLFEHAFACAAALANGPTRAHGLTKRLLVAGQSCDVASYLQMEAVSQAEAFASEDHRIGVRAFRAKERPHFVGR